MIILLLIIATAILIAAPLFIYIRLWEKIPKRVIQKHRNGEPVYKGKRTLIYNQIGIILFMTIFTAMIRFMNPRTPEQVNAAIWMQAIILFLSAFLCDLQWSDLHINILKEEHEFYKKTKAVFERIFMCIVGIILLTCVLYLVVLEMPNIIALRVSDLTAWQMALAAVSAAIIIYPWGAYARHWKKIPKKIPYGKDKSGETACRPRWMLLFYQGIVTVFSIVLQMMTPIYKPIPQNIPAVQVLSVYGLILCLLLIFSIFPWYQLHVSILKEDPEFPKKVLFGAMMLAALGMLFLLAVQSWYAFVVYPRISS